MKTSVLIVFVLCVFGTMFVGCCRRDSDRDADQSETVAEGVIFYVKYQLEDGKTGGLTRLNMPQAVPGGNGDFNVDAYGRLTRDFLIITYPQQKDMGPRVIPTNRLMSIRFGDGGIKTVNSSQRAAPK